MKIKTSPDTESITIEGPQEFLDAIMTYRGNVRITVGNALNDQSTITLTKREAAALGRYLTEYAGS